MLGFGNTPRRRPERGLNDGSLLTSDLPEAAALTGEAAFRDGTLHELAITDPDPVEAVPARRGRAKKHANGGHRQRLTERFVTGGAAALPDYELLELLLFQLIPQRDTKPIARQALDRFGSLPALLAAPVARLAEIDGLGESSAVRLKVIAAVIERSALRDLELKPIDREQVSSWRALMDYCTRTMGHAEVEQFRILFLDKRNRLIADEVQQEGTVDHTSVYIREVSRRALYHNATALILLHNHPSGDPTPSRADIEMTKELISALAPLNVAVHDHVVISSAGHCSLKGQQLI